LGKGLTSTPCKNAAVVKPWQQKPGCSAIKEEEGKGFVIKICMLQFNNFSFSLVTVDRIALLNECAVFYILHVSEAI
jgi:hypothetical protein